VAGSQLGDDETLDPVTFLELGPFSKCIHLRKWYAFLIMPHWTPFHRRVQRLGVVGMCIGALQACALAFPMDRFDSERPGLGPLPEPQEGGPDCGTVLPIRPDSGPPDQPGDTVLVVDGITFVDGRTSSLGYDLDQTCTTSRANATCTPPRGLDPPVDGIGGVDNAAGTILGSEPFPAPTAIANGGFGLVFVLRQWNGMNNDPSVDLSIYNSPGSGAPLRGDGTDTLAIVDELGGLASPSPALYADTSRAFVSNGTLVAHLSPTNIESTPAGSKFGFTISAISHGELRLPMDRAVLTATIVGGVGNARLRQGVLSGAILPDELLLSLPLVRDPSAPSPPQVDGAIGTQHLCVGTAGFRSAKAKACAAVDLREFEDEPICGAISTVLSFSASPGRLGSSVAPRYTTSCPLVDGELPQEYCE
jgi:hypothetical protein